MVTKKKTNPDEDGDHFHPGSFSLAAYFYSSISQHPSSVQ